MTFSVIIPTYNRIAFLEKAIESVERQTFKDYEIIVVNDDPNGKNKLDDVTRKFDKVKVIHHEFAKGGNAARNTGIVNSTGQFIAFLDDDDIWLPEKLSFHFKEHEEKPDVGLIFSDCLYVYDNRSIPDHLYTAEVPGDLIDAMSKATFCPATSSIVSIRRECVERCGLFDENLVSFQDWDYWFRIAHFFQFVHIPAILVHFRQHLGDRTSNNEEKRRKGIRQIQTKWREKINAEEFGRSFIISIYYKNCKNFLLTGKKFAAFRESFKLLTLEVLSVTSIKRFLKVLLELITIKRNIVSNDIS